MWSVASRENGDEITDGAAKDAHRRGEFGVSIRRVPILKHGALERVGIQITTSGRVVCDEPFYRLDADLGSAVTVGKRDR